MPGSAMAAHQTGCATGLQTQDRGTCAYAEVDVLKAAYLLTNLQHVTPYFLNSLRERSVRRSQDTGDLERERENILVQIVLGEYYPPQTVLY